MDHLHRWCWVGQECPPDRFGYEQICRKATKDSVVAGMSLGVTLSRLETIREVNRCQNLKEGHLKSAASLWLFLRRNKYSNHTLLFPFFQSLSKRS